MKPTFKYLFLFLAIALAAACNNSAPEGEKVESGEAVEESPATENLGSISYAVNTGKSYITWVGAKAFTGTRHTGKVYLQDGLLSVDNGQLTGGSFTINMTSLEDTDLEGEKKQKLETHLKSGDFFEVEKFPAADFVITSVEAVNDSTSKVTHRITGNLTMKDISRSITIPAQVSLAQSEMSALTPSFVIDRTEWDVMYNAGVLGTAKDNIIKDEVSLQIMLIANPQKAANTPAEEETTEEPVQ